MFKNMEPQPLRMDLLSDFRVLHSSSCLARESGLSWVCLRTWVPFWASTLCICSWKTNLAPFTRRYFALKIAWIYTEYIYIYMMYTYIQHYCLIVRLHVHTYLAFVHQISQASAHLHTHARSLHIAHLNAARIDLNHILPRPLPQLELIEPKLRADPCVEFPVNLERYLMEGSYSKVWCRRVWASSSGREWG